MLLIFNIAIIKKYIKTCKILKVKISLQHLRKLWTPLISDKNHNTSNTNDTL